MFGFKKIIFVLVTTILLLGLVATPLTVLARPEILKVAVVVDCDKDRWMTQVIPSFENENTGVKVAYDIMPWELLYEKIMAIIEGRIIDCYDVVFLMSSTLPELSEYAEDLTDHRKDFESAGIDFAEYNGKIFGVNSPGPHADQDWMLIISKNSKNRELALKLLKLAVKDKAGRPEPEYVEGQVVLQFFYNYQDNGFYRDNAFEIIKEEKLEVIDSIYYNFLDVCASPEYEGQILPEAAEAFLTYTSGQDVNEVVDRINKFYPIEKVSAGPNFIMKEDIHPDDPRYVAGDQWGLHNKPCIAGNCVFNVAINACIAGNCVFGMDIDAPPMWTLVTSSKGFPLAIIDSGVDVNHADLVANIWQNLGEKPDGIDNDGNGLIDDINGWNFGGGNANLTDAYPGTGHGTNVAGVAGAVGNNKSDIAGVCWGADLMVIKIWNPTWGGTLWAGVKGLFYAVSKGANVANLSWGFPAGRMNWRRHLGLFTSLFWADLNDVVVVASAGNAGVNIDLAANKIYPASYRTLAVPIFGRQLLSNLIVVTSIDCTGMQFYNWGKNSVDLEAPGVCIRTTSKGGGTAFESGTSFAAPHVTGVAALIRAVNTSLTNTQVIELINKNVKPLGRVPARTNTNGMLNGFKAVYEAYKKLPGLPPIRVFVALIEFYVDELLGVLHNLSVRSVIDILKMLIADTPIGNNYTLQVRNTALAELDSLRGREKVNEEDIPKVLAALDALRRDAGGLPGLPQRRQILSQDNFSNSGSGWSVSKNDERKKTYKSGKYSITVKKPNWQFISWAPGKSFPADFEVKVDARKIAGPTGKYGIIWGKDGDNYYVFTISSNGRYRLRKQVNDVWQKNPVPWTNSPAIKRGTGSNKLKVNVIGNSITLIVNDTVLTTVKGSSFGPGKIGLVGGSFDETGVEVQFDNLMIYDSSL